MANKRALSGAEAIAYAMRQINPDVVALYPITPQTPIAETFAKHVSDGLVDTELILTESEHSSLSAVIGASASGVRAMTATASQGLLYMYEMLSVASGLRLPIVMAVANRAISSPINIHCDHSDSMSALDQGWLQFYCESSQEAYEMMLFALRLSESVNLPSMVCIDGFITSHCVEPVVVFEDNLVKKFIGEYTPKHYLLDTKNPITVGPLVPPHSYFEVRSEMFNAFNDVKSNFNFISKEFKKIFKKDIKIFEDYFASDSDIVLIVLSSSASTSKQVIDKFREQGKKVGLLRPILLRPFFYEEYFKILKNAKQIIVLERAESPGSFSPIYKDLVVSFYGSKFSPQIYSYVFGLGGRDLYEKDIEDLISSFIKKKIPKERYIGLK